MKTLAYLLRVILVWSILALAWTASAHVGSPDVFFDGNAGPYPIRATIRMPTVVPGRAEISVRIPTGEPVDVSFLPLYARTAITNAPPPDQGILVRGETNLYSGELWLMTFGAYSIEIRVAGPKGAGSILIPVNSVAIRQLPMSNALSATLLALGVILFIGGLGILAAANRESTLGPEQPLGSFERRKGYRAAAVGFLVFTGLLAGGWKWWAVDEEAFRSRLRPGAWPDMRGEVQIQGFQRVLNLRIGEQDLAGVASLELVPDHGKLVHLFLIREPAHDVFAHIHPVRSGPKSFAVALPPLAPGRYTMFCDLAFEGSGLSSTATNEVVIPPMPTTIIGTAAMEADPDDSWANAPASFVAPVTNANPVCHTAEGYQVIWKCRPPLHPRTDASLNFEVRDPDGQPVELEPYMGMFCHAAVLRDDDSVFAHLHPTGNFSMGAMEFFDDKLRRENANPTGATGTSSSAMDHSKMHHAMPMDGAMTPTSSVSLPYEFPTPGKYRVWTQFKISGQVVTAAFAPEVSNP